MTEKRVGAGQVEPELTGPQGSLRRCAGVWKSSYVGRAQKEDAVDLEECERCRSRSMGNDGAEIDACATS
jgi:hypothetical protein